MKKIFGIVLAVCAIMGCSSAQATSVSATGTVHSTWTTNGIRHVKIIRPDGSTLAADCGANNSAISSQECSIATVGETAWGRADCSGGFCSWTCLEVVDDCTGFVIVAAVSGTVTGKDMCAGVLYMTLNVGGSDIRARCEGSTLYAACNALALNDNVDAGIRLHCSDGKWDYITP